MSLSKDTQKRLEWMDWYFGHGKNAKLTCRHFGISPDTFYRWKRRFDPQNLKTLESRSRRPKKLRTMTTPPEYVQRVVEIRKKDLEKSKYEIQEELKREGISLGTTTIQKIINRHPELLNTQHKRKIRSRKKLSIARIKASRELKNKHPGSLVQTDNGSEYLLHFHRRCQELGIPHYFTDPQCPKQNGRVKRFHQVLGYQTPMENLLEDIEYANIKVGSMRR